MKRLAGRNDRYRVVLFNDSSDFEKFAETQNRILADENEEPLDQETLLDLFNDTTYARLAVLNATNTPMGEAVLYMNGNKLVFNGVHIVKSARQKGLGHLLYKGMEQYVLDHTNQDVVYIQITSDKIPEYRKRAPSEKQAAKIAENVAARRAAIEAGFVNTARAVGDENRAELRASSLKKYNADLQWWKKDLSGLRLHR